MYELQDNKKLKELLERVLELPILNLLHAYRVQVGIYAANADKEIPIAEAKKATKLEKHLNKCDVNIFIDTTFIKKSDDKTIMAYIAHELLSIEPSMNKKGELLVSLTDRSHKLYEQVYDYFGESVENVKSIVKITRRPSRDIIEATKRRPRKRSEIDVLA